MLPRRIAGRYAEALFNLAQQQGTTAAWGSELEAISRVIEATPELREVLTHPEIPLRRKELVVTQAFGAQIAREVLALLFLLLQRGRDPDITTLHAMYLELWNRARRLLPVTVTSALPMSQEQAQALAQTLARRTGATIQLQQEVDPELIAGLVVRLGDRVIDASARTALQELRESMTGR